ncbi:MAG: FAD-binding protein, partial [Candidatus Poseidoniales archaeon]
QFHPTALALDNSTPFLITEALRGHGAVLMTKNEYKEWNMSENKSDPNKISYMSKYSLLGSLGTRDVVARATDFEMKKSGEKNVLLITEHLDLKELTKKFPTITERLAENGIKIGLTPIPVTPAAHYMVGGISVNNFGQARCEGRIIEDLYAIGEVACTGLHGANRIIKNINLDDKNLIGNLPFWRADNLVIMSEHSPLRTDLDALRSTMTSDVGIVKSNSRLKRAKRRIFHIAKEVELVWRTCKPSQDILELRNLVVVAELVIDASMERKVNIGLHYNRDLEK